MKVLAYARTRIGRRPTKPLWLTSAAACLAAVVSLPASAQAPPEPPAPDAPLVFHIPRAYLPRASKAVTDLTSTFELFLLLPDLKPASTNPAEFSRVGWHNQFTVLINRDVPYIGAEPFIAQWTTLNHVSPSDYKIVFGCRFYTTGSLVDYEIYACHAGDAPFIVKCLPPDSGPFPFCTISEYFTPHYMVTYTYSRTYLQEAVSIETTLHALLLSFTVIQ